MILTVTLNPAIDKTVFADRLVFEDRAYITSTNEAAGGRGLNASRVLHSFGAETMAIAPSGGESGSRLESHLARLGFPFEVVPIGERVRTNLIITDEQGLTVKLNEPGATLTPDDLERFAEVVEKHLPKASWLLVCGSLPPGVPPDYYRRLIAMAKRHNVKTLLDTDAEALQDALLEAPGVVTPNQHEAARLLNKALITRQHLRNAVLRLEEMGADSVVLSLAGRGAMAGHGEIVAEVVPPRVDAVCPIGAGDALNAAFAWSIARDGDFLNAVRWGVAAGTASAMLPGLQFANMEQTEAVYRRIESREVR